MRRHWSVKTGIFSPKIFLLTSQRRSSNRNTEKFKRKTSLRKDPPKSTSCSLQMEYVQSCTDQNYLRVNKHDGRKHPLANTEEILEEFLCNSDKAFSLVNHRK